MLDDRNQWTVLSDELEFGRSFRGVYSGRMPRTMHVLRGGEVLTTGRVVDGSTEDFFHVMDREGRPARSFGSVPADLGSAVSADLMRVSATARGDTFWVAPSLGARTGMVLEQWTARGDHVRTIVRDVPWLPPEGYSPVPDATEALGPTFLFLESDIEGLLWVGLIVRSRDWEPPTRLEREGEGGIRRRRERRSELQDLRVEVIDPAAGEVLASMRIDEVDPAGRSFRGTVAGDRDRHFYRATQDSLGFIAIEIFRARLYRK